MFDIGLELYCKGALYRMIIRVYYGRRVTLLRIKTNLVNVLKLKMNTFL